jgi:DNA invertase Pin-like site-specific DNA recombinase
MHENKPLAFSYVRFSTPEQAKGDSLRRQSEAAEAWAVAHGMDLSDLTLRDLGRSAYRGKNLQDGALSVFRRAVEDGDIPDGSYLLLESPDRLSRLPAVDATEALTAICKLGITVVTLDDGQEYDIARLRRDFHVLLKWLLRAEVGHDESRKKAYRVAKAWAAKRQKASEKKLTAICPYWLRLREDRASFETIPERVEVVRRIVREALDGQGQESIARSLNQESVPTFGRGQRWHKSTIAKLLRNEALVGTYQPHKMEEDGKGMPRRVPDGPAVEGYYPAVIEAEAFATLQARMGEKRAPYVRTGQTITNPLAGIARCGLCGSAMTQVVKGHRSRPRLVCSNAKVGGGCEYHSFPVDDVWRALGDPFLLEEAPTGSDETRRKWERAEAELRGAEERVQNLVQGIASVGPSPALRAELAEAERDLSAARDIVRALAERARVETPNSVKRRLQALVEALEGEEQDAAAINMRLRENVSAVIINPAKPAEMQAASLTVRWLHGGETEVPLGGFGKFN